MAVERAPDAFAALCLGSDWAIAWLSRNPQQAMRLLDDMEHQRAPTRSALAADLEAALAEVDCGDPAPDGPFGRALRTVRNRRMIGIVLRDLCGVARLEETVRTLSDLADVIIEASLARLQPIAEGEWGAPPAVAGEPQRLIVLAMGKLGARELNLSSDIDLIFAFRAPGIVAGGEITTQEFFVRLGRRLIALLNTRTLRGFVFRVDMRLRPYGEAGPLVQHVDAMLDYYREQGRDWERYAMVKARVVSGEAATRERLEAGLRPFVYRRYLDFGAFEALRDMKTLIVNEVRRRKAEGDVKLGAGGIREIEFVAQVFQLVHGGRDPALRARALLDVLPRIERAGLLNAPDVQVLTEAYRFLRDVEHRLQARSDAQTQRLPAGEGDRARLAATFGLSLPEFEETLVRHRAGVRRIFDASVDARGEEPQGVEAPTADAVGDWSALWRRLLAEDTRAAAADALLSAFAADGVADPGAARDRLMAFILRRNALAEQSVARERIDALLPAVLGRLAGVPAADRALAGVLRIVEAVLRRSVYVTLLTERPRALNLLMRLVGASERIAAALERHPSLLDELLDESRLLSVPTREGLKRELAARCARIPSDDPEAIMEQLRHFKVAVELRLSACELEARLPLMRVSDALTWLAEVIIDHVIRDAFDATVAQYGAPSGAEGVPLAGPALGVIAYGKLGGLELGWGSDLDLVFLHDLPVGGTTLGPDAVRNGQFIARMAQRIIHALTARTFMGQLYEIDLRLRPSGRAGVLVSSLEAFQRYQQDEAWTWEQQALVRARAVAGSPALCSEFERIRRGVLAKERSPARTIAEVVEMRDRMLAEARRKGVPLGGSEGGEFDLKQAPGGVVDIEFMVQSRVLGWAQERPELLTFTDVIRILETAAEAAIVTPEDAEVLVESYKAFRAEAHLKALADKPARTDSAELHARAATVRGIWGRLMTPADGPEAPGAG